MICKHCGKEFNPKNGHVKYCSDECRKFARYLQKLYDDSEWLKRNKIENKEYIIDQWNGVALINMNNRLYLEKMHPGKTIDDYKKEFPDALVCSEKYKHDTSVNSGKFMKTDEYRKKYSEMFKGEKNPNHKSKTTERERKERSPFSEEFYKKHGGDRDAFIKNVCENRSYNTQIDYYLNKGMSYEEAKSALFERQRTFTLDKCIERYGEDEGIRIFTERQRKWSMKCKLNGFEHSFIDKVIEKFNLPRNDVYFYGTKQLMLKNNDMHETYFYDFAYGNRIIEVNGDFWHMNPDRFECGDVNCFTGMTASETWSHDGRKRDVALSSGYEVMSVWESDIRSSESLVFDRICEFLWL